MLILVERLSSTHITDSSQSPAEEEKSLAKHVLDTITVSLSCM